MNRREVMEVALSVAVAASLLCPRRLLARETDLEATASPGNTIHPNPVSGADVNSGIANDFKYRNNVVAHSNYIWIVQGAASARREAGQADDGRPRGPGAGPREPVHYTVHDSLFAANEKFTGSGAGPALNSRDVDSPFLELAGTKMSEQPVALEMDQTKRNNLHPSEGSDAARIGAGLFTK